MGNSNQTWEKKFCGETAEYWDRLLRKVVEMPFLQVHPDTCSTPQVDKALSDLIHLWQQPLFKKKADTRDNLKPKFIYNFHDTTNTDQPYLLTFPLKVIISKD